IFDDAAGVADGIASGLTGGILFDIKNINGDLILSSVMAGEHHHRVRAAHPHHHEDNGGCNFDDAAGIADGVASGHTGGLL
ncbi:hypothetical protein TNIN_493641, partial [Trichonephila inaurata madagascariensis]